jgi:hypothetical protein
MQNDKLVEALSEAFGQNREEVEDVLGISLGQQLNSATTLEECHRIFKEARDRGLAGLNARDSAERKGEKLLQKCINGVETFEGLVHLREYIFTPNSKVTRALDKKIDGIRRQKLAKLTTIEECQVFSDEFSDSHDLRADISQKAGEIFTDLLSQANTPDECDELEKRIQSLSVLGKYCEGPIRLKKLELLLQMLASAPTVDECVEIQRLSGSRVGAHEILRKAILRAAEILRAQEPEG